MIKKIKEYFTKKREIHKLILDTIRKLNNFATTISNISDNISSSGILDPELLIEVMENIQKIATSPELTSAYYSHIADIVHAEKMEEMKRKSE